MWINILKNTNYSVNEEGKIKNNISGRIKKPSICKNGYFYVDLYDGNVRKKYTVHRLIAETFLPNPENKPCINHIDKNRKNNSITNLEWCNYSKNNVGVRSELIKAVKYEEVRKEKCGSHVCWGNVLKIIFFKSITETAEYFKCSVSNISQMLKQNSIGRRGIIRGYKFEYCKKRKRVTTNESVSK